MLSPVVFAVKQSIAERLGWIGRTDLTMDDILKAVESGDVRFAMTNATRATRARPPTLPCSTPSPATRSLDIRDAGRPRSPGQGEPHPRLG